VEVIGLSFGGALVLLYDTNPPLTQGGDANHAQSGITASVVRTLNLWLTLADAAL